MKQRLKQYHMNCNMHDVSSTHHKVMTDILNHGQNFIIFHHNDNDGTLAAYTIASWIDKSITNDASHSNIIYIECNHTTGKRWKDFLPYIPVNANNFIIGVDLALPIKDLDEESISKLNRLCIFWSDHHVDTDETYNAINGSDYNIDFPIYCRKDICGAGLAYLVTSNLSFSEMLITRSTSSVSQVYELLDYTTKPAELPELYRYVDIRDRFLMDSDEWNEATVIYIVSSKYNTYPNCYPESENFWYNCCNSKSLFQQYTDEGINLWKYRDSLYNITFKATGVKVIGAELDGNTYDFIAINGVGGSELFGKEDLKPDYDFCMVYYYTGKEYKYSIFTNKDISKRGVEINLQKIAVSFGGGGHKHASGFISSVNLLDTIFKNQTAKL